MYLTDYGLYIETIPDGSKFYYLHGQYHREDGPAIEWDNGDKEYYLYGLLHREDGPAIEYLNGNKYYFLHDRYFTEDKFNKRYISFDNSKG